MVDKIYCDHCGAEAHHVYTKEFDGKRLNFCCKGCLGVYEMIRDEGMLNQDNENKSDKNSAGKKN